MKVADMLHFGIDYTKYDLDVVCCMNFGQIN